MRRITLYAIVVLTFAALANAECQFNANFEGTDHFAARSGQTYALTWTQIPGATSYSVTEAPGYPTANLASNAATAVAYGRIFSAYPGSSQLRYELKHFASADTYIGYSITALTDNDTVICSTKLALKIVPDAAIHDLFRRVILPVAGSLVAADGSRFHTSLRLSLPDGYSTGSGRIIFHPQGAVHSDNDPQIAYHLQPESPVPGSSQYWDDVVAAMGASGLGTIDIVPDNESAPEIDARAWNDIDGITNGGTIPALKAGDVFRFGNPSGANFPVWTDSGKSRMNIGFRSVGPNPMKVFISTQGMPQNSVIIPGNSFKQFTLESLLGFIPPDGQRVSIFLDYFGNFTSSGFVYYTITDNSSNDPRVFVPQVTSDLQLDVTKPVVY